MTATILTQDPHRVRESRENVLEVAIGREVRAFRRKQEITVAEPPLPSQRCRRSQMRSRSR
jgi:hypothetical protein